MDLLFLSNVITSLSRWEGLIAPAINVVNVIVVSPVFHLLHLPVCENVHPQLNWEQEKEKLAWP